MKNIQAIIFDLDDTLLDRKETFQRFAAALVDTYFLHLARKEEVVHQILEIDQEGYKDKKQMFAELIEVLPWLEKPDLTDLMTYYKTNYVSYSVLKEHAIETLEWCRQRYKIGVVTNGTKLIQYGKIDHLGIRSHFDCIIVSEEAGTKKPDIKISQLAAEVLGVSPQECLFIGDHPANDIGGAGNAGMDTIWLEGHHAWKNDISIQPKHTIKDLSELKGLLEQSKVHFQERDLPDRKEINDNSNHSN
jgi:putative hydrolase of the HAD superfamily